MNEDGFGLETGKKSFLVRVGRPWKEFPEKLWLPLDP